MACKTYEIDADGKKIREITDAELKQRILEDADLYEKVTSKKTKEATPTPLKENNIEISQADRAKGFVKLSIDKVKKALSDFQGRTAEYSKKTYDSIVSEAQDGTLNISSIPPIQIWGKTGELLAGHSRIKAFEDLASGKIELNEKFKPSDFKEINTQIVEAETREEAKKIAERSNSGSQQTPFENSRILAKMREAGANKTAIEKEAQKLSQHGDKKHTINLSHLDKDGKAAKTLEALQKNPEQVEKEKLSLITDAADKAGEMRKLFPELTRLHEDEIFDAIVNKEVKTSEVSDRVNRVVNGLVEPFDANAKLNLENIKSISASELIFQQKTADIRNEIRDLKKSLKKDDESGLTGIQQKVLEDAVRLNNGNVEKSQKEFDGKVAQDLIAKRTDAAKLELRAKERELQMHLASKKSLQSETLNLFDTKTIDENINNKTITNEQANRIIDQPQDVVDKREPIVKNIESKAESENEADLNEAIAEADRFIAENGRAESGRAEAEKQQSDKEVGQGELSKKEQLLKQIAENKKKREEFAKKKNNLGATKDGFSEAEEQAKLDREAFDLYVGLAKEYIKDGIKSAKEWADAIGEELTDTLKGAWETAKNETKKKLLTERAYEGEFREEVKREIEKLGLTREIESQIAAKKTAKEFIDTVGEDFALDAIENHDVEGGVAAFVFNELAERNESKILAETDAETINELLKKQARLLNMFSERATKAGQFSAALKDIYDKSDLGYSYEKKVSDWKKLNNGEISPEIEAKFKELDTQLQDTKTKLADAQKRLKEAQEQQAFNDIKESVKRKPTKSDIIEAKKVKAKAEIGEALNEISDALGIKLSAVGDKRAVLTKALIKLGKGLIDLGEANAQNVVEKIKEQVESKFKGKVNFSDHEKDLIDTFEKERPKATLKNGKLIIPDKLIRNLVENGIDNIDDLTKAIKSAVSEELPDITDREIRDAVTKYGKTINPKKDDVSRQIRKIKDIGRVMSQLEDIANKKRPLKSGLQRDKLDAEQRAKHKELREALKEMPLDDEALANEIRSIQDTKKARLQNRIEDLQREIDTKTKTEKSKRSVEDDEEIKQLREQLEGVKKEHDKEFSVQNEVESEAKRLNTAKKNAQRRIEDLQRRLREGDFSVKEKKTAPIDEEITKLRAEKLRIQDEYDKEFYKNKLKNRTKGEVIKDHLWELWGITRALRATGEMSYVGVQGLVQTIAHPQIAARAFKNSLRFIGSERKTEQWLRELKSQEYYPTLKESKLAISEPNAELSAREELFYSGWTNILWDSIGTPLKLKSPKAYEKWVNANPMKALERGAVGYLDTIRVERFLDGMQMLQEQGKSIETDKEAYKNMADVINTFTGRASLGAAEQIAPQLSKIFFSPRNWASALKQTILLPRQIVKWQNGEIKPTVANKMAIADLSKFIGTTTGIVMMAASALNNDDRDDTYVEIDPRSSDFGKIRIGKIRVDPWGGKIQQIVLASRMIMDETKSTKNGKIKPLGGFGTPTREELLIEQATNKLAPSAGMLHKYLTSKVNKNGERTDKYGNEYSLQGDFTENLTPIYWGSTIPELIKEDPNAINGILAFYAFFGGGVNVYNKDNKKK